MHNHAYGLPLPSAARWNCRVDEELRRELLARRDEDQRIRNLVPPVQQRAFLHSLRSAAAQGQASRAHLAYLADERRAEAGLEPFADYEARMRDQS
jgi:hypothetical protein